MNIDLIIKIQREDIIPDLEEDTNLLKMQLRYSSDEEIKPVIKKRKSNNQPQITSYFEKK